MQPRLLALDSSTDGLSLAACDGDRSATWHGPGGAQASLQLLPQARTLLQSLGLRLSELHAIAWGQGPGTFTGLRSACAVAQGLAFGAGLPVLAVDSLRLVAEAARARLPAESPQAWTMAVAVDARMGELYAARYGHGPDGWRTLEPPALWTPAALAAAWRERPAAFCTGSGLALLTGTPPGHRIETGDADRPGALLRLARAAWTAGEARLADTALPSYVRDRVALTTAERAAARAPAPPST